MSECGRAETALAESEARFRTAFVAAPIGMALVDPDGHLQQVNPAFCAMLGYTEAELLTLQFQELTHPEDLPANLIAVRRLLAGEIDTYTTEKRYCRKDGHVLWAYLSVALVRDADGAPQYFIAQVKDITERKTAAAALAEAHQRTQEVLERITDGFLSFDRSWCFTYLNTTAEQTLGRRREELLGKNVWVEFPEARDTPFYTAVQRAMTERVTTSVEFFYPPFEAWFEERFYPSPNGVSAFFTDITERKQVEAVLHEALAEAEAANRVTHQFLTMMSHELRTPLQAIKGYAELLLGGSDGALTLEQAEDIRTIHRAADRLVGLVKQMLDLSRLEAGQLELTVKPVNLAEILETARRDILPLALQKGLVVHSDLPTQVPPVQADPMALYQIVLNLVGNAVKFTEAGHVHLTADATDAEVVVAVRDTGIGIVPEALRHIFDEFHQAAGGMGRHYEGAGLGLAIAKKLAELMGGRITVESEFGRGSIFRLHLVPETPPGIPSSAGEPEAVGRRPDPQRHDEDTTPIAP